VPRICGTCKELVLHDSRKCPKKKWNVCLLEVLKLLYISYCLMVLVGISCCGSYVPCNELKILVQWTC
jgi:hypothetical protein